MAVTFGKNLPALSATRLLNQTTNSLQDVTKRLSSGIRIHDDSLGQALSSKFNNQNRVFSQAYRNVSDGISFMSVADAALGEATNLVTRMGELANQAANGSLSKTERLALQSELTALDQEMRRITQGASFNGRMVFRTDPNDKAGFLIYDGTGGMSEGAVGATDARGRYVQYSTTMDLSSKKRFFDTETDSVINLDLSDALAGGMVGSSSVVGFTLDNEVVLQIESATGSDLFLYDFEAESYTQLTASQDSSDATRAVLSADGNTVLFQSETLYQNGGTKDDVTGTTPGTPRMFALDLSSGKIYTNDEEINGVVASQLAISADGTKATYRDSTGHRFIDLGNDSMGASSLVESSFIIVAGITSSGKIIGSSVFDLAGNGNSVRNFFEVDGATGTANQITSFTDSDSMLLDNMSFDGSFLNFAATGDYTGENGDSSYEFFRLDITNGEVSQLSNINLSTISNVAFAADGSKAFATVDGEDVYSFDLRPGSSTLDLQLGFGDEGSIQATLTDIRSTLSGLGSIQITSQAAAQEAVDLLAENLTTLTSLRGEIGATISRLDHSQRLVGRQRDELAEADSKIRDIDVASETALFTALSIKQQAGTAMLAQANLQPELAARLLELST